MKRLLLLIPAVLSGCALFSSDPETIYVTREVPGKPVPCVVPSVEKPADLVNTLTVEDNLHHKTKVILAERELNRAYKAKLEAAINVCNQKD